MGMNPAALQRKVKPGTARRAMGYARPYLGTLLLMATFAAAGCTP